MKTIKFSEYEICLIIELIHNHIENINSGIITYGSKENDEEYKQDYQNILNKLSQTGDNNL